MEAEKKAEKPGAIRLKLKQSLKSIIANRRLENLTKRQQEEMAMENGEEEEEEEEEEYEPYNKHKKSVEIEIDEEENPIPVEYNEEVEEEQQEEQENEDEEEIEEEEENEEVEKEEDVNEEEDNEEKEDEHKKMESRIIKPFLNDSDDDDLLQTQVPETKSANTSLLDISLNWGGNNSAIISQIPTTQPVQNVNEHEEELLELCSGTFETQLEKPKEVESSGSAMLRKLLSSDEEEEDNGTAINKVKKLRKKRVRPISDDEDESEEEVGEGVAEELDEMELKKEEEAETYVDYDSEENEVIVKVTKDELRNKIQDFVENEAELSESEWGSADEDEKNLDKYDIELGDEDEFDKDKLKYELEQIHARKMLDEDIRQVRKIQDLLFDTEETDGAGRKRQFKWKNTESGFSLDDSKRDEDADKNADSDDDENYEKNWRKLRFEREQMLQEQRLSIVENPDLENVLKIHKVLEPTTTTATPKAHTNNVNAGGFLISNEHTTTRSSFLERDKELLSRIAGLKKNTNTVLVDDDSQEAIATISTNSKGKKFLFATISAEEHENNKRKADHLLNESAEHETFALKKRARTDIHKNAFIDQLL